jgi:hypothetical protein
VAVEEAVLLLLQLLLQLLLAAASAAAYLSRAQPLQPFWTSELIFC